MERQSQFTTMIHNQEQGCAFSEDYISQLHDSLIHHIFSFLPIKNVIKCCTLSKRWKPVWTTIPALSFDDPHPHPHHPSHSLSSLVDSFMNSYSSPKLKKLHLGMPFVHGHDLTFKISQFLEFAINRQVEDVSLVFQDDEPQDKEDFALPISFYNDHTNSLQNVFVRRCSFRLSIGSSVNWPSLKALSIEKAPISDAEISIILAGCPILESLKLTDCWGMNCIHLNSKSLKGLIIAGYYIDKNGLGPKIHEDEDEDEDEGEGEGEGEGEDGDGQHNQEDSSDSDKEEFYVGDNPFFSLEEEEEEDDDDDDKDDFLDSNIPTMEINAPYLQSLRIKGIWYNKILKLVQAPSLLEAELRFFTDGHKRVHSFMLRQLYKNLQHVNDMIIQESNFEDLLYEKSYVLGPPLFSVEMLENNKYHLKKLPLTMKRDDQDHTI